MTDRLNSFFAHKKIHQQKALITYLMGGDPDYQTSLLLLHKAVEQGADILEIGMAFSDPMADGPAIQAAALRALKAGASLEKTIQLVKDFRQKDTQTPIILMGYFNPIFKYSTEKFLRHIQDLVDGVLIVDLPPEENEISSLLRQYQIPLIRMIAPTSDENRLSEILKDASGFLYYVSVAGITGTKSTSSAQIKDHIALVRSMTDLPLCIGFGIKNKDHVRDLAPLADGIVVGSALVELIEKHDKYQLEQELGEKVRVLKEALGD
jgi:tryptophan synthase alpha chain